MRVLELIIWHAHVRVKFLSGYWYLEPSDQADKLNLAPGVTFRPRSLVGISSVRRDLSTKAMAEVSLFVTGILGSPASVEDPLRLTTVATAHLYIL